MGFAPTPPAITIRNEQHLSGDESSSSACTESKIVFGGWKAVMVGGRRGGGMYEKQVIGNVIPTNTSPNKVL